jgi:hypothetical protein
MLQFADITGLSTSRTAPKRYLWTDAFAVCNFLELYRQTEDQSWHDLALRLVDQVHHILGRQRSDAPKTGWISGLGEEEGELHPTRGGLRIGKRLNERRPDERSDERLEWDRDGQYYHYLTKWMHALHRVSRVTGDTTYLRWAIELAQTAHAGFSYAPSWGAKRLYWKMSVDLSQPQVSSMGQHDPLDGLVTYCELQAAATAMGEADLPDLHAEISDLGAICHGNQWATDDTLGIGGLLWDASRIAQLTAQGGFSQPGLFQEVADAALLGLQAIAGDGFMALPVSYRLAFRELGLSIGLRGVERLSGLVQQTAGELDQSNWLRPRLEVMAEYLPLAERIESFWLEGANKETGSWKEHREINMVMLATSLAPGEFLKAD